MDTKRRRTDDSDVSDLRLRSRQQYLEKREIEKLAILRQQVLEEADEEARLGEKLSRQERAEFARNRETLRLAEARNNIDEHLDGYILPDADFSSSSKNDILTRKHKEKGYEKSEVQLWEDEQTRKVQTQIKKPELISNDDYEFVFDTAQNINFDAPMVDLEKLRLQEKLDEAEVKANTIELQKRSLPVFQYRDEFLQAVKDHQVIVLVGATGSGKTTQLTQYLQESGYGKAGRIGCTQPRRVAAISVAKRVAEEVGCKLGTTVGFSVRFESAVSDKTEIEYMTDGLALRMCLTSPDLGDYSVMILDEAHERTLATDILMSLLKDVCLQRPEFRLIIASATLAASKFSSFFGRSEGEAAPIMNIPGRLHDIKKHHVTAPEANYLNAAVTCAFQIHMSQKPSSGDILIFLTGEEEILAAADYIAQTQKKLGSASPPVVVCPVYGALPSEAQQLIFNPAPEGSRKIVLATNIAETSLTIDGISYVIDCGLEKQNSYNAASGMNQLITTPCSRASAEQRAGRAGRTGPGMAFRLYTKWSFTNELPESTLPEILRISLDGPVLTLKAMGINDILHFDFMDAPPVEALAASLETLYALGYLDSTGAVTKLGRRAAELPIEPRLAKCLLTADTLGCVDEVVTLVAMIQEAGTLFFAPKDKKVAAEHAKARFTSTASTGGDLITFLNVWNEFVESEYSVLWCRDSYVQYRSLNKVRDVRDQLLKLCERVEILGSSGGTQNLSDPSSHVKILKSFLSGYFASVATLGNDGQSYRTLKKGQQVHIHPSSVLRDVRPKLITFAELVETSREFVRVCAPIDPAWLTEMAPHYHKEKDIDALGIGKKMGKGQGKIGTGR